MELVLTSKLGTFIFDEGTKLSLTKLVRDTVTGQFFSGRNGVKIRNSKEAETFVRSIEGEMSKVCFELIFNKRE